MEAATLAQSANDAWMQEAIMGAPTEIQLFLIGLAIIAAIVGLMLPR